MFPRSEIDLRKRLEKEKDQEIERAMNILCYWPNNLGLMNAILPKERVIYEELLIRRDPFFEGLGKRRSNPRITLCEDFRMID